MRRVLAIGGGSFQMESEPSPVDGLILRLLAKPRPRVCFISTPSGDLPEHIEKFHKAFPQRLCEATHLAFFRMPSQHSVPLAGFEEHLLQQDAIYVGGGNTRSALGVWRQWGLDSTFARAYESGILLTGMSAGAMCWFEAGVTDSFWGAGFKPLTCLGLLSGGCAVHYNSEPGRRLALHAAVSQGLVPATIAIDDYSAVLFEDGEPRHAYRWGSGQGAYAVSASPEGASERALPSEEVRIGA